METKIPQIGEQSRSDKNDSKTNTQRPLKTSMDAVFAFSSIKHGANGMKRKLKR